MLYHYPTQAWKEKEMDKTLVELLEERESFLLATILKNQHDITALQNKIEVAIAEHSDIVRMLRINGVNTPLLRLCANTPCHRTFVSARKKQLYCSTECRTNTYKASDYWQGRRRVLNGRKRQGLPRLWTECRRQKLLSLLRSKTRSLTWQWVYAIMVVKTERSDN